MRSAFLVLALVACPKEAQPPPCIELAPAATSCTLPTACEAVLGPCGRCWVAANRLHAPAVRERVRLQNLAMTCAFESPARPSVTCEAGRCAITAATSTTGSGCDARLSEVRAAINRSRSCRRNEDCVLQHFGCPFGCATPLASVEVAPVAAAVAAYGASCPECRYRCPSDPIDVACRDGLCTTVEAAP
jgi:hypothetical protein